jgi:hypothetical protein
MRVTERSRERRIFIRFCEQYGVLSGRGQLYREFVFLSYCSHWLKNNEEEYKGILKKRIKVEKGGTQNLGK